MTRIGALLFGAGLLWGLFQHAGKEPEIYLRLFLFLGISILFFVGQIRWPLLVLGSVLILPILALPAIEARGWIILALGWMGLVFGVTFGGRKLLLFLIVLGGMEALAGLVQSLGSGGLATGTFTNQNHFVGLLNMTIPLAVGALYAHYARSEEKLRSELLARAWIVLLCCGFMGLGILLSLSRGGTVSLILTVILLAWLLASRPRRVRQALRASAAWMLLFVILGLGLWVGLEALITRFGAVEEIENSRMIVYADTLEMIRENPLGVGPGMYPWRFRPYQSTDASGWWNHAHNDYLETGAEWGAAVALMFWIFAVWRFMVSVRTFLTAADGWRAGMALGCAGAIFSILLHSLADFNLQISVNWLLFCIILGLTFHPGPQEKFFLKIAACPELTRKQECT